MSTYQNYGQQGYPQGYSQGYPQGNAQLDPQGFFGSLLGKAAGGIIGKHFGGNTGRTVGSIAGGIAGGFLPFDAGAPQMQSQAAEPVSELEMQGFWNTFRKIGRAVGTGVQIGQQLGVFDTGGPQMHQPAAEPVSEIELQSFWNVWNKMGNLAKNVGQVASGLGQAAGGIHDAGKTLGLYQAGGGVSPKNVSGRPYPHQAQAGQQGGYLSPQDAAGILQQVAPVLQTLMQQQGGSVH